MRSHRVTPPRQPKPHPLDEFFNNAKFDITLHGRGIGKSYAISHLTAFQEAMIGEQVRIQAERKTNRIVDITTC